jgi:hypothetical protein
VLIVFFLYLFLTVPFEEDDKDPSIWFLDHNYHESMFSMFKRINGMKDYCLVIIFAYFFILGNLM